MQLRRTDRETGQAETVLVPCGSTLDSVCPPCAERAKTLRAAQCREGWHLEDEPDLTSGPATQAQQWWVTLRAEAQRDRDQADQAGNDTTDFDELIAELDAEIAKAGIRGKAAPARAQRRHRSTRRRQDAPDLPKRKISPRTIGKTYTAPDGKTFRPSLFVTLTCPSYGRVGQDGTPVDPASYGYGRAARDALHFGVSATDPDRYAWELVAPGDPDHMDHARRLLHAVADRARWLAALNEARRRAATQDGPNLSATGRAA